VIDVDFFKKYNDSYGHPAGDRLLITFSEILKEESRTSDVIARLGGEEFAILLPATKEDQAQIWANRLRATIEGYKFENREEGGKPVTASFGIAALGQERKEYYALYKAADTALYRAKSTRNTVCLLREGEDISSAGDES